MVKININIGKKHLFVFCIVIGVVAGMIVAYAYNVPPLTWTGPGAAVPSDFGHSVDEIAWDADSIMKNIGLGGGSDGRRLWVQSESGAPTMPAAFVNNNRRGVAIGALDGATALGSIQAAAFGGAGNIGLLLNPKGGNVGIGTSNPIDTLHVNGDAYISGQIDTGAEIHSNQRIYNSNDCRLIKPSTYGGDASGSIDVPIECIDNNCLIVVDDFTGFVRYMQNEYIIGGNTKSVWSNSPGGGASAEATAEALKINGDTKEDRILTVQAESAYVYIEDDNTGIEESSNQWWWIANDWDFKLYVCF